MRFDCCRSSGSAPRPMFADSEPGVIPGAISGSIPKEYAAKDPIYFEGPISLDDFLAAGRQSKNNLDMRPDSLPSSTQNAFMWPFTSRLSFVSALSIAILTALAMCGPGQAFDGKHDRSTSFADSKNVRIAHNAQNLMSSDGEPAGRVISFVCGRPDTLQALAPIDLPGDVQSRYLPQGASPIAEMKFMPVAKSAASTKASAPAKVQKLDSSSTERIYQRLLKLSLADPAVYNAEAPSLITYFSILTGGQDQKRVEELEKILDKNLNGK